MRSLSSLVLSTVITFALAGCGAADGMDNGLDPVDGGSARRDGQPADRRPGDRASSDASTSDAATARSDVAAITEDGATSSEICDNGSDDDHDGMIDEGCPCIPGSSQSCYPGAAGEIGVGTCAAGRQGCEGAGEFGTWTECVGAVVPSEDVCGDGIDQDCNGRVDDGAACTCARGATRPCYTGRMGTEGIGICRGGMQECEPSGTGWGTCLDQVLPRAEICSNRIDDDCNGVVDDGTMCVCPPSTTRACYPGPTTEIGRGVCRAGTQRCDVSGARWSACTGAVGPSTEICGNGLDDDCDGVADDGCSTMPRMCTVTVNLSGDCLTARCPSECPYPIGCNITMAGGDDRGCVASASDNPVVYFQEGNACGAGHVEGTLRCSSVRGAGLAESNCPINKPHRFYPTSRTGCPT